MSIKPLEFKVAQNLARNEGEMFGYFAAQSRYTGISRMILQCLTAIDELDEPAKCIPIVTDEFGLGQALSGYVANHSELAGLVTFGTDEDGKLPEILRYSHLRTVAHEVGRLRDDFLVA